jgi:TolB-like protein/DNA-binding winged helix-turn-helix (wHTH) protein/Flp pilus assembly protein TadD
MVRTDGSGTSGEQGECYRFGAIVVDAPAHTITRSGEPQPVEPKAFAVLLVLLRHAGQLVHRDDLLDTVWGHRHVTPNVLTRVIAQLRAALDDDPHRPRYIQTQHALGYRFIGELIGDKPIADKAIAAPVAAAPEIATPAASVLAELKPIGVVSSATPLLVERRAAEVSRLKRRLRWRPWIALAAVVVVAIAALVWFGRTTITPRPANASIAVLPFSSLGTGGDDTYFARGLAVEMHDALAGVQGLKVAAYPVLESKRRELDAKALGKLLGVATVLDASVRREGQRVRVSARLTDTRSGFTLWTETYDRELADVFAVQSEIAEKVVLALLGVLPANRPSLMKRLAPTRDIEAYEFYLQGLNLLRQPGSEQLDEAIASFQQALAADAGFARAQAGICRAEIKRFELERNAAAFARARMACLQAEQMDPSLREVSLALGEMHRARGEFSEATKQYTRALDDVSLRPDAYIGLSQIESAQERNDLALDYIERAHRLRPGDASIQREIGYLHYLSGNLPAAIEAYRIATTLSPDDATLWSTLGGLYYYSGENPSAAEAFQHSLKIKPSYGALSNLGTLRYGEGRYADAAMLFRQAAELNADDFRVFGNIGDALAALPASAAQARESYRRAAELAGRYVELKDDDAQAMALLAWYRANLGDADAARQWLAKAEALKTDEAEVALFAAQTFALLNDVDAARTRLARARSLQVPEQRIRASPVLRQLEAETAIAPAPSAQG